MIRNTFIRLSLATALLALAGCASDVEREFGSSVRHMVQGQVDDPSAPANTVGAVDGARAAKAVDDYRAGKTAAAPAKPAAAAVLMPVASQ